MNQGQLVTEALDGLDCVRLYDDAVKRNENFDVVLIDEDIPFMPGKEATKALRARGFVNPIIGLTSELRDYVVKGFVDSGANAVLTKPLNLEALQVELSRQSDDLNRVVTPV